ncbi:zinc finger, C2H2 type [Ancylostoma ceylanicum]|uniref:Zinc finger, C2H2 type n=1 Tax=Ancylostoma ceylanicum TaxID=53326 RepID=A0A0D6LIR0_9BILA|nr:zinc finger, C2H2 type [Ancylostoma ceylanicum]
MHPPSSPSSSMQEAVSSSSSSGQHLLQNQHSLMQRLLMGAGSTQTTSSARNGIEDIAARLHKQNGNATISASSGNGYYPPDISSPWGDQVLSISNNTPMMHLTCLECGINKNNSEDMEVHLKREHLNWLPFQCPICLSERASDAEMREHLHSSHRKNMNKFIYVDNVTAKRSLQLMMDRALSHAMARRANNNHHGSGRMSSSSTISPPAAAVNHFAAAMKAHDVKLPCIERSHTSPVEVPVSVNGGSRKRHIDDSLTTGNTNTDALLASISRATSSGVVEGEVTDELDIMPMFNNKRLKSEYDQGDHDHEDSAMIDDSILDNLNPISVLDNVAALFASDGRIEDAYADTHTEKTSKSQSAKALSSAISKKRVLGECSKCQKPVTAGARQMHMFFHLAKDHGTFRFRCLFEGCTVEHYRKDQMENHQSKVHGKIDPEMMEDRSLELFHRCQELSMELLGTKNGSTPGPTAAKAEAAYNAQLAAQKEKNNKQNSTATPAPKPAPATTVVPRPVPDEEHPLECRLCHKTMQNRIRGFHILWHMAKDMGINRYICRVCGFGHDRSQSVQVHGKKEHGTEEVVQDRIGEYSDEVKQMSEQCFGFQALFAQENKRRNKIPAAAAKLKSTIDEDDTVDDLTLDLGQDLQGELDDPDATPEEEPEDEQEPYEDEEEERDSSVSTKARNKKRQSRFPRFGLRRPKSKSKRTEMAKLREISMLLGGAQYFKKKLSEAAHCEKCGKMTNSRMSEHAYTHMEEHLFLCPLCDLGHQSRELVVRHIREIHESDDRPVDNRLKHAKDIKAMIRECYPAYFVDAPIPTQQDIEKLKQHMGATASTMIAGIDDEPSDDVDDEEGGDYEDDSASEPKLVLDDEGGLEIEREDDEEQDDEEYAE